MFADEGLMGPGTLLQEEGLFVVTAVGLELWWCSESGLGQYSIGLRARKGIIPHKTLSMDNHESP